MISNNFREFYLLNKEKLVITGASGFLGRNTLKLASKSWNTIGLIRRNSARKEIIEYGATPEVLENFSPSQLIPIFENAKAVINFLGIVTGSEEEFQKINVDNFEQLVRSAERANVEKVIMISGLGVGEYGKKAWATNNYFKSKLKMEKILQNSSVSYVIFRPSYILGPQDELIPSLIKELQRGHVNIIGPGSNPMQPIFIKDVVRIFLNTASGIGNINTIYDLVGPEIITMDDFVRKVKIILEEFLDVPNLKTTNFTVEEAETILGFPREVSDIFLCDSLGNPKILEKDLQMDLTSLDETIRQTIRTELGL